MYPYTSIGSRDWGPFTYEYQNVCIISTNFELI